MRAIRELYEYDFFFAKFLLFYRCLPLALLVIMLQHRQLLRRCYKIPTNYIHPQNFTKVTKFTVMNNYPCMAVWFAICIKLVKNLNMCNLISLCLHNQSSRHQPDYIQSLNVRKMSYLILAYSLLPAPVSGLSLSSHIVTPSQAQICKRDFQ